MLYTGRVQTQRFEKLASELATRDRDLPLAITEARVAAVELRERAEAAVEAFRQTARKEGADHLADIRVGPVEPDEKHVDCVQFRVWRGRFEIICVAKAEGAVRLVGPFRRGKSEKPCLDQPPRGEAVERALEELLEKLIREASER